MLIEKLISLLHHCYKLAKLNFVRLIFIHFLKDLLDLVLILESTVIKAKYFQLLLTNQPIFISVNRSKYPCQFLPFNLLDFPGAQITLNKGDEIIFVLSEGNNTLKLTKFAMVRWCLD